ncbi:MAG: monovalent cation/H+ antiporter complex subunit F [Chloroflexota bacterium]
MTSLLLGIAIFIAFLTAICLYRIAVGRTLFDRMLGASLVGTNGFILLILIGFIYGRIGLFIDIAISYALLNFVVAIMLGKYFERGREKSP